MKSIMINLINTNWFTFQLWASPGSSIYDLILQSSDWSWRRRAAALTPGFPCENPVKEPPTKPVRPMPNDVPTPEPNDVPVHGPIDVPVPEPGTVPTPAKPAARPKPQSSE